MHAFPLSSHSRLCVKAVEQIGRLVSRRTRGWGDLDTALLLATGAAIIIGGWAIGGRLYDPATRIPAPTSYPLEEGILGANQVVRSELRSLELSLGAVAPIQLELAGPVFELGFPRVLIDRVFDRREERAVLFSAETPEGLRLRFLLLRDGRSPRVLAVDPLPLEHLFGDEAEGTFIELPLDPERPESPLMRLRAAVEALLPEVDGAEAEEISSSEYTIFGSFGWNDAARKRLDSRLRGNVVLAHLVDSLAAAKADVSVGAPVYSVRKTQASAIYLPGYGLAQRPLWRAADLDKSLGHELSHAYIDRVLPDPDELLRRAMPYFAEFHPRLYGQAIPLFYEELVSQGDIEGSVEEALAFIVGALADSQTETSHVIVRAESVRSVNDLRLITEPILSSDVELLIGLGLLPRCMGIEQTEFEGGELPEGYFTSIQRVCLPGEG